MKLKKRSGASNWGISWFFAVMAVVGSLLGAAFAAVPTADPGKDQTVQPGVVHLDARGSRNPNKSPLNYQWTSTGGPASARLSSETTATPSVSLTVPGTYTFGLRVFDGHAMSQFNEITITVLDLPPSCGTGPDQFVPTGSVTLTGWATDPNQQPLNINWTQVQGPHPVTLSDTRSLTPTFVVPANGTGTYAFALHASDGTNATQSLPVRIEVDDLPEADAGVNPQTVDPGQWATLNASGSTDKNPEDNPLSYHWSLFTGPENGELTTPNDLYARFRAKRAGDYVIRLVVRERTNHHEVQTNATVTVRNVPPHAVVGPPINAHTQAVNLDGSASSDENGDPLTYSWTQTEGPAPLEISDPTSARPSVRVFKAGEYKLTLVVNDGQNDSDPAEATISMKNIPPVPQVIPFLTHRLGHLLLDGTASVDADGDPIRFLWSQVSGPVAVPIREPGLSQLAVFLPVPGVYVFQLQVGDGISWSFPARCIVTAR